MQGNYEKLLAAIRPYGKAAIAFSGGVDSTLLTCAAAEALGKENIICVTARTRSFPEHELIESIAFCGEHGIRQMIVDFDELGVAGFAANPPNRCYLCKHALFTRFKAVAEDEGIEIVLEGSNASDTGDYRPGMLAVEELGVISPLKEAGLAKEDVRAILKELGLPAWEKQSNACLATRVPYGEDITAEKLALVGKAEQFLLEKGYKQVRVRIHGDTGYMARIEVLPEEIAGLAEEPLRSETEIYLKKLGFSWVALDLVGYRTGSLNEALTGI